MLQDGGQHPCYLVYHLRYPNNSYPQLTTYDFVTSGFLHGSSSGCSYHSTASRCKRKALDRPSADPPVCILVHQESSQKTYQAGLPMITMPHNKCQQHMHHPPASILIFSQCTLQRIYTADAFCPLCRKAPSSSRKRQY